MMIWLDRMMSWLGLPESIDENGASAVEYGLLVAGIAGVVVAAVFLFGGTVADMFGNTCDTIGSDSGGSMNCETTP
jgi:pilus assembly protein Flp/PilA